MAIMTTQLPDGVAFEQQTQPVPSSDKMALDLDINGNTNRDETTMNAAPANPNDPLPFSPVPSDNTLAAFTIPEVNGAGNADAFSSNQAIVEQTSDVADSQAPQASSISAQEIPSSDEPTTTKEPLPASSDPPPPFLTTQPPHFDSAIVAAIEDVSASTTVPLVIEAPESDLRHNSPPVAPEQADQPAELDLHLHLDSAQLPTPQPEKEVDVVGVSAEVADLTFNQNEAALENPLDLATNSPLPSAPIFEQEDSVMQTEQATPAQVTREANETEVAAGTPQPTLAKITRVREDDDEVEPSAKRTKTETEGAATEMAPPPPQNDDMEGVEFESAAATPLTTYEVKELLKIVKAASRSINGKNFRAPVAELWPAFAQSYAEKIAKEVDLKTMEKTLAKNEYASMDAFKADVQLIYNNALTFNGLDHMISNAAFDVRNTILNKITNMPPEPIALPKRDKKAKKSTPAPEGGPRDRRVPRGPAPTNSASAPTFAVDPVTSMPVIRRDSTKVDGGRPKRDIVPPRNKDIVYPNSRPKNKKVATELKFCEEVLHEVMKHKNWSMNHPFMVPVDPVALGIPNYFAIIKKPMDLETMSKRLRGGDYASASDFEKDMRQIIWNCFKFNPAGNPIHEVGRQFEKMFDNEWKKKDSYIAEHSPSALSPMPESDYEEDDEEEEEDQNPKKNALSAAKELLLEHQQKLIDLMSVKNRDDFAISMQQDLVATVAKRVHAEEETAKKKNKKLKASKAPKRFAPPPKKVKKVNRPKFMGTLEKETISAGLTVLPDRVSMEVLDDIKRERPGIDAESEGGTLELDIDSISHSLLWKIHGLIMHYAPEVQEAIKRTMENRESPKTAAKPPPKKKNKPMSSVDQERNIKVLEQKLDTYHQSASHSQEPVMATVEESSGDTGDSSDSEEE